MRPILTLVLLLASAAPALAEVQFFFLHEGPTPVPVPGGTSIFYIDEQSVDPAPPLVEQNVLARGETAVFPTFTSTPFAADKTLLPIASIRLAVAANQKMRTCATIDAAVFTVDASGNLTPNGSVEKSAITIEQGNLNEIDAKRLELALVNPSLLAGQGFAVSSSLTSDCAVKRRTFFLHAGSVRFQCCFTTAAKCGAKKILLATKGAACRLAIVAKESSSGKTVDPVKPTVCDLKMTLGFAKFEARGGCLTTGDGPDFSLLAATLAGELDAALDPLGPNRKNKCQARKIKAANNRMYCLLKAHANAAQKAQFFDLDPRKVAKCEGKFTSDFGVAETLGGCDTTGDAAAIATTVDTFVTTVASRLACPCP
jgi:hypothetical protein